MEKNKSFERLRLTENSRITGTDFEEFKYVVKDIDQRTHTADMRINFLTLIHALNVKVNDRIQKYSGFNLSRESLDEFNEIGKRPQFVVMHNYMNDELWRETFRNTKLIILSDPQCELGQVPMTISPSAMQTFLRAMRLNNCGPIVAIDDLWRNGFLADVQLRTKNTVKVVYREFPEKVGDEVKNYWKIFFFGSSQADRHVMIPQEMIPAIIMELQGSNKIEVKHWSVTNAITEIYSEFPELAAEYRKKYSLPYEITPGIRIATSDIGASSFCVQGTIKIGDSEPVVISEVKQIHKGEFSLETFIPQIKEDIFGYYETYVRKVVILMKIPYTASVLNVTERCLEEDTKKVPKKASRFVMKNTKAHIEGTELDLTEVYDLEKSNDFFNECLEGNVCESTISNYSMEDSDKPDVSIACNTMLDYFNILMCYGTMYNDIHRVTKKHLCEILVGIPDIIIDIYIRKIKRTRKKKRKTAS